MTDSRSDLLEADCIVCWHSPGFGAQPGWEPCRCWWWQNNHRRVYCGPLRAAALQSHRQQACSHTAHNTHICSINTALYICFSLSTCHLIFILIAHTHAHTHTHIYTHMHTHTSAASTLHYTTAFHFLHAISSLLYIYTYTHTHIGSYNWAQL